MFTKQPVKHLANLPTKTQNSQSHVQVIESDISLSPSQTAGQKLLTIVQILPLIQFLGTRCGFQPGDCTLVGITSALTINPMEVLLVFQRSVLQNKASPRELVVEL